MKLLKPASIVSLVLAVILSAPAFAVSPDAHSALPGTLNYVEGQANIGAETLNGNSIGSATLQPGQTLNTGNGKAEILLTPGVFLRVDDQSAVKMISPSITDTELELQRGRAMVEVAEIHAQNNLRISEDGIATQLVKKGLYEFDADQQQVVVFDGKARVQDGDRGVDLKGEKKLDLNTNGKLKPQSFDKSEYKQSDLYQWSSLRSSYLAEANAETAPVYISSGYYGPGWFGPGWYWAPAFGGYTFIPGDGFFLSPFGWRFYSPLVIYRSPWRYGYAHPSYGRPGYVNGFTRGPAANHNGPVVVPRSPEAMSRRPAVVPRSPAVHNESAFHGGFSHGGSGGGQMTATRH